MKPKTEVMSESPGSRLEDLCPELLEKIFMMLDMENKKVLRLVNTTVKSRVEDLDWNRFKYWRFHRVFTSSLLIKFSRDVHTILGLEVPRTDGVTEVTEGWDEGIDILVQDHPEIQLIRIGNERIQNLISDTSLQIILLLPSLISLELHRTKITGERLKNAGIFSQIETLKLVACPLSDLGLKNILDICGRQLKCLDVSKTNISGEVEFSANCVLLPNLEQLNCHGCVNLSDVGLLQLLELCQNSIKTLDIGRTSVSGQGLVDLQSLPSIKELNCHSCLKLSDLGFEELMRICGKTLSVLILRGTNISGESLIKVDRLSLVELDCSYCTQLSDLGLLEILRLSCRTLESLDIGGTKMTGNPVPDFKGSLPSLLKLDCYHWYSLTDIGLLNLLELCGERLQCLNISYCPAVSDDVKQQIKNRYKDLKILGI